MKPNSHRDPLRAVNIERTLNAFAVLTLIVLSVVVFTYQIILNQLPCPICLLIRFGFLAIALGFLLNLRFGLRPSHYSLVLLSALFTSFTALQQIFLNLTAEGYYQSSLFHLHLPTWAFIISMTIVVVTAILLGRDQASEQVYSHRTYWRSITHSLFAVLCMILLANMITA